MNENLDLELGHVEEIDREGINNDSKNSSENIIDYKRIFHRFDLIDCLWMCSGCYIFKKNNK